jgi:hypothetical protein
MFRDLKATEIEVRVARSTEKGVFLLLYKDARCDMNILDEKVGAFGWQRKHQIINDVMYCGVSVKDADGLWITKWDAGSKSNTEEEKGQASDSFKRACVNWGIGRKLYTAPMIWVSTEKYAKFDRHKVSHIAYDDDGITELIIKRQTGETIYSWSKNG